MSKYVSPFYLLNIPASELPDRQLIQNQRKVLLAKLELSGKTTIALRNTEYTKDALIKLFDELLSSNDFNYHALIAQDPDLLEFLETGTSENAWTYRKEYEDPAFISFLSPWFVPLYTDYVKRCIRDNRPFELGNFFRRYSLLDNAGCDN